MLLGGVLKVLPQNLRGPLCEGMKRRVQDGRGRMRDGKGMGKVVPHLSQILGSVCA